MTLMWDVMWCCCKDAIGAVLGNNRTQQKKWIYLQKALGLLLVKAYLHPQTSFFNFYQDRYDSWMTPTCEKECGTHHTHLSVSFRAWPCLVLPWPSAQNALGELKPSLYLTKSIKEIIKHCHKLYCFGKDLNLLISKVSALSVVPS